MLSEAQRQGITDEELDDTMWEAARPWEKQWESLGTHGSKWEEQELNDDDRQARFWRRRPDTPPHSVDGGLPLRALQTSILRNAQSGTHTLLWRQIAQLLGNVPVHYSMH